MTPTGLQALDIQTVRLFLAVIRAGSIGGGARREHIAASAISRRIGEMEATLGVRLLRRLPRGVEPTHEGRIVAAHAEHMMAEVHRLTEALRDYSEGARGTVWIGAVSSAFSGPLPDDLAEFQRTHPDIILDIQELNSREAIEAMREGSLDLAVVVAGSDHHGLAAYPLDDDPLWLVAPRDHALAGRMRDGAPIPFVEAARFDLISMHQGGTIDDIVTTAARDIGLTLNPTVKMNRFGSLRRMVAAGFGLGIMRRSAVLEASRAGTVIATPLADAWARGGQTLLHRHADTLPKAVQSLKDHLLAALSARASAAPGR